MKPKAQVYFPKTALRRALPTGKPTLLSSNLSARETEQAKPSRSSCLAQHHRSRPTLCLQGFAPQTHCRADARESGIRRAIAYVIVANSIFGLIAGYLYWQKGLEAAIIAHMSAHLVIVTAMYVGT